jgi:cell fate (sporulation/competence/biofilm development) regulator YlbF (YheA/YmcA/DUF963 family)
MLVYDKAHELANEIKKSADYMEYARLKEIVMADEKNKPLISDYKRLQLEAQAMYIAGNEPNEETMGKLKKLGELLAFNPDITAYFAAEYRLQTMIGDIYKILGEACDFGFDLLSE